MERANSAVIESHFVAGVDIFHSVHLLHQHQFSLPKKHTLFKNYCRKRRLSKYGHSFPSGQIASYHASGNALIKKTRDIIIFLFFGDKATAPAVWWQSHQVPVISNILQAMFSQTFFGTLPLASPGFYMFPDGRLVTHEINKLEKNSSPVGSISKINCSNWTSSALVDIPSEHSFSYKGWTDLFGMYLQRLHYKILLSVWYCKGHRARIWTKIYTHKIFFKYCI